MSRLCWLSDTHFNVLPRRWRQKLFVNNIKSWSPDYLLITGDITTGKSIESDLIWLSESFQEQKIFFVMGNHDYHGRSFQEVNEGVQTISSIHGNLTWLSRAGVTTLVPGVAIIGNEGWYDASHGDPSLLKYTIDWLFIKELREQLTMNDRIDMFIDLAESATISLEHSLIEALQDHDVVYVATHFPPWPAATTIPGTRLEQFWLPYSVNGAMGAMIEKISREFPAKQINVLSGHTHIPVTAQITPNVMCQVNRATRWGRLHEKSMIQL